MLLSQQIPTLIGGISQQNATFRRPNQCEDSLNVYNDPVNGVKKRPGTTFVKDLEGLSGGYFGAITRDETEKYIFNVQGSGIKVWNTAGQEQTVTVEGDYNYIQGSGKLKHLTVADTTFILNQEVTVTPDATLTTNPGANATASILISVTQALHNNRYYIDYRGVAASYSTPASGALDAAVIASNLVTQLNANSLTQAAAHGSTIVIRDPDPQYAYANTALGSQYINVFNKETDEFSSLPRRTSDGVKLKVTNNSLTPQDDYYVRFDATTDIWVESVANGISKGLDSTTMPHVLVKNTDGSFTFKPFDWSERLVGDDDSNPQPSFVGHKLNNLLFERGRLGFLSDINIILSKAGDVGNFYRTTTTTVVDDDPIDLSVSGRQVNVLKTSVGVRDGILLFSDEAQHLFHIGDADILSPETASVTSISNYQGNTDVEPTRIGESIFFATQRDQYSGVREYFYESGASSSDSASITNHVPRLIPENLDLITGSSTENIVFFLGEETDTLFVYQYLYSGEEKVVSSWGKWRMSAREIVFAHVFEDELFLVLSDPNNSSVTIERVSVSNSYQQSVLSNDVCLDSLGYSTDYTGTFDGTNTTFEIPYYIPPEDFRAISLVPDGAQDIFPGDVLTSASVTNTGSVSEVSVAGDWTNQAFMFGRVYKFLYQFSQVFLSIGDGDIEIAGRLQVRNMLVELRNTGDVTFTVDYTDASQVSASIRFISNVTDWSAIVDMSTLATDDDEDNRQLERYPLSRAFPNASLDTRLNSIDYTYTVPILSENTGYTLTAENDGWQPVSLSKAQWEANFHKRSRLNR